MSIRFSEQDRVTAPIGSDGIAGFRGDDDVHYTMDDLALIMRTLLADALITPEERTQLESPIPVVRSMFRYYRGATAPSIDTENEDPGPGWTALLGSGTDAVWRIEAATNNGTFVPPWGIAVKISGEDGINGLPGDDGTPGNEFFFQGSAPSSLDQIDGNVWWDSANNFKQYRWQTDAWVPSFQPFLITDASGRVSGLVRAGESEKDFVLVADKFQVWNGVSAEAPFEIIDNVVYIKNAAVRQLAAAKLIGGTIAGQEIVLSGTGAVIKSDNYVAGTSGWKIDGEGAEFPSLVVRSGNIEANAATRRYGSNFTNTGLLAELTWHEVGYQDVTMVAGNTATITVSFQHATNVAGPYAADGFIRILRADNSEVKSASYSLREGNTLPVSYQFYDETPTTRYRFEFKGEGGTSEARGTTMTTIIYRK